MADGTNIEWTDATWNPTRGCTRVSEGCRNCYAEVMAARFSDHGQWGHGFAEMKGGDHRWTGKVELIQKQLMLPMRWKEPRKIFVNSTSDLFHESLPDESIDQVFAVMTLAHRHTMQVLTKRPERMRRYMETRKRSIEFWEAAARKIGYTFKFEGMGLIQFPLPNVWLGVSCEDQETADARIPDLLDTPAAVRFLSCEPLLEPINLRNLHGLGFDALYGVNERRAKINWTICGGESGPHARPMQEAWAESLLDQCAAAGTAFFMKQLGGTRDKRHDIEAFPAKLRVRQFPDSLP